MQAAVLAGVSAGAVVQRAGGDAARQAAPLAEEQAQGLMKAAAGDEGLGVHIGIEQAFEELGTVHDLRSEDAHCESKLSEVPCALHGQQGVSDQRHHLPAGHEVMETL